MPKTPTQRPVYLNRSGEGEFASVNGFNVPGPPEGCESQQLMDWGSTLAVLASPHNMGIKLRMIEAYCARYSIGTTDDLQVSMGNTEGNTE